MRLKVLEKDEICDFWCIPEDTQLTSCLTKLSRQVPLLLLLLTWLVYALFRVIV